MMNPPARDEPFARQQQYPSSPLPTGTVTFLFTDIEGSTPLWEKLPADMQAAVAQHHAILRQVIEAFGGHIFQIVGDAFQAAFPLASQGLSAAIASQGALQSATWGATGPIRVRMGLHTGPAALDPISGPEGVIQYAASHTLNRAARVMSAGHGGQILVSQELKDLIERTLPEGVQLVDLGQHRLKGMQRLEHLYQVLAPGLVLNFPPLSTSVLHPNNLPQQVTSFIGRETEIAQLTNLFHQKTNRIVTVTGAGGTGKTRLSLRLAEEILYEYTDGAWLVELAQLRDPDLVPVTVAHTFNLNELPGRSYTDILKEYLSAKCLLLILDNCEHVVSTARNLVSALIQACPGLQVLVTSRELLGIAGEVSFSCPSLALPNGSRASSPNQQPGVETAARSEAVQLFVERAARVSPGFSLNEKNAPAICEICRRLDGIPLAIELAAARSRLLSVQQIASRLDDAFHLLTGGSRTALPRQQTLKALIDWSYHLLLPDERSVFLRLSLFMGGWDLEAAEAVTAFDQIEEWQVMDLLGQLVDKSLVQVEQDDSGIHRYHMLETIRQYARDRLLDSGEMETVRTRHMDYFFHLSQQAESYLHGKHQMAWLDRLEKEWDNYRLALEWAQVKDVITGLQMCTLLMWFFHMRSKPVEGLEWLERMLAAEAEDEAEAAGHEDARQFARGEALIVAGFLKYETGQWEDSIPLLLEARDIFEQHSRASSHQLAVISFYLSATIQDFEQSLAYTQTSLDQFRQEADSFYIAECGLRLSSLYQKAGKLDTAWACGEDSLMNFRRIGDQDGEGRALYELGWVALMQGQHEQALLYFQEYETCVRTMKNIMWYILALGQQAWVYISLGNYQEVLKLCDQIVLVSQEHNHNNGLKMAHMFYGWVEWATGDYARAVERSAAMNLGINNLVTGLFYVLGRAALSMKHDRQAEDYFRRLASRAEGIPWHWKPFALHGFALLAAERAEGSVVQLQRAAALFSAQQTLFGWFTNLITPVEQAEYARVVDEVRAALGDDVFKIAWAGGQAMTQSQVFSLALEDCI